MSRLASDRPSSGGLVVASGRPEADVVRSGAELVALSERLYGGLFVGAIAFVGLAALASLAILPLRSSGALGDVTPARAIAVLLVGAVPVAVWRAGATYRRLRLRPAGELALVAAAAALIALPPKTELWWPSCALLMLLATFVPFRRVMGYCVAVLAANLAAHLVAGDLTDTPAVSIVGLWIGYVAWTATFVLVVDRLAAYIMRLNAGPAPRRPPPVRVHAWVDEDGPEPAAPAEVDDGVLHRLTARQLQVVSLLADGLRHREVAACLSISVRQVERHVANAIARLGVSSVYELVAVAVGAGLVPRRPRP